jgi:DNA-binding MarR family transcriptional regulator
MLDNVAQRWLRLFDDNTEFYSAIYWDLLTRLWKENKPVRRTDALRFMTSIKSAATAGKYIDEAIQQGLLCESTNPQDARSKLLTLSPDMRDRLDAFFDEAIDEVRQANLTISQKGPVPGMS